MLLCANIKEFCYAFQFFGMQLPRGKTVFVMVATRKYQWRLISKWAGMLNVLYCDLQKMVEAIV